MTIRRGAFGMSSRRAYIESPRRARGWPPSILLAVGGAGTTSPSGIGLRRFVDDGSDLVETWVAANATNLAVYVMYDLAARRAVYHFQIDSTHSKVRLVNLDTGATVWDYVVPETDGSTGSRNQPVFIKGDRVWVVFYDGAVVSQNLTVRCLSASDGSVLWTQNMGAPASVDTPCNLWVDADQSFRFTRNYTMGLFENWEFVEIDLDGSEVSATDASGYPIIAEPVRTRVCRTGNDVVISEYNVALTIQYMTRRTANGAVIWRVATTNRPMFATNDYVFALNYSTSVLAWHSVQTGALVDSVPLIPLGFNGGLAGAAPAAAGDVYVYGGNDTSGDDVYRVRPSTKALIWEDSIVASGLFVYCIATRPNGK